MSYTKTLETERLILRKATLDDAEDIFNNYRSREKVTKFLTWKPDKTINDTVQYLKNEVLTGYDKEFYYWAIELKSKKEVIGHIRVTSFNKKCKNATLAWVLSDDYWGQGIMPEAAKAVLDYLKSQGFVRIEARHKIKNINSGKVMQKLGFKFEGIARKAGILNTNEIVDMAVYSFIFGEDD